MNFIARFDHVSTVIFNEAAMRAFPSYPTPAVDSIPLPRRATYGSAGYDFVSPFSFSLECGRSILIPTGIRVFIEEGWFLALFPRSGLGFKYRLQLDNSVGIIDSDYVHSDNEGHILVRMTNDNREGKTLTIQAGERIVQGVFIPFGLAVQDNAADKRNGGFGSTDSVMNK